MHVFHIQGDSYWLTKSFSSIIRLEYELGAGKGVFFKEFSIFFKFQGNFDAQILKVCKMDRTLRIKELPVLFCKYLCNDRSDLYEIWNLSSEDSKEPTSKVLEISVQTHGCIKRIWACMCQKVRVNI